MMTTTTAQEVKMNYTALAPRTSSNALWMVTASQWSGDVTVFQIVLMNAMKLIAVS